jgi:hypothetical protein
MKSKDVSRFLRKYMVAGPVIGILLILYFLCALITGIILCFLMTFLWIRDKLIGLWNCGINLVIRKKYALTSTQIE